MRNFVFLTHVVHQICQTYSDPFEFQVIRTIIKIIINCTTRSNALSYCRSIVLICCTATMLMVTIMNAFRGVAIGCQKSMSYLFPITFLILQAFNIVKFSILKFGTFLDFSYLSLSKCCREFMHIVFVHYLEVKVHQF